MGNLCGSGDAKADGDDAQPGVSPEAAKVLAVAKAAMEAARKEIAQAALPSAAKFADTYTVIKPIGRGAYAHVDLVEHKVTKEQRAAKFLPKRLVEAQHKDAFVTKIACMRKLQGLKAMVRLHEFYDEGDEYIVVLEYLKGGMVFDHVFTKGHFGEREAADVMQALLQLLAQSHSLHMMHRDLKPENLLLADHDDEHSLRVIDWGTVAWVVPGQRLTEVVGTPYYVAPEILRKDYCEKADVWSAGVIMYILLSGHPPFPGRTDEVVLERVKAGKYDFDDEEWEEVTLEAKDMIAQMLTMDDSVRPSAQALLSHPWFRVSKTKAPTSLSSRIISRLRNFVRLGKLKRLALVVLARALDDADVRRLKEQFVANMSHEGMVDLAGMQRTLGSLGIQMDKASLEQLWQAADEGRTGEVNYDEFIAAIVVSNRMAHANKYGGADAANMVKQSFELLDHDQDGVISAEDLLHALPGGTTLEEARAMLCEVDQQGRVDYQEFSDMMQPKGFSQLMSMHSMLTGVRLRRGDSTMAVGGAPGAGGPSGTAAAAAAAAGLAAAGPAGGLAPRRASSGQNLQQQGSRVGRGGSQPGSAAALPSLDTAHEGMAAVAGAVSAKHVELLVARDGGDAAAAQWPAEGKAAAGGGGLELVASGMRSGGGQGGGVIAAQQPQQQCEITAA